MFNSISLCYWSFKTFINFYKLASGDEGKVKSKKIIEKILICLQEVLEKCLNSTNQSMR
jgi:hypothetical protein